MSRWDYYNQGLWMVVPTGRITDYTFRFPDLPDRYAAMRTDGLGRGGLPDLRLLIVPVDHPATIEQVQAAIKDLQAFAILSMDRVVVPALGAESIPWDDLAPVIDPVWLPVDWVVLDPDDVPIPNVKAVA